MEPAGAAKPQKKVTIIVNSRPHETEKGDEITFEELVQIAFPGGGGENPTFTVTYRRGHGKDGTLASGQSVKVKDGMVFNVDVTNRS
jgi:hypothetical protein